MTTKALISNDQIFENLEVFFIVAQKAKNSLKETFSTEANALIIPLESLVFLLPLGSLHFCLYDSRESIFLLIRIATSKKLLVAKSFAISKKLLLAKRFAISKTLLFDITKFYHSCFSCKYCRYEYSFAVTSRYHRYEYSLGLM